MEWTWDTLEVILFWGSKVTVTGSITLHNNTSFPTTIAFFSHSLGGDTSTITLQTCFVVIRYSLGGNTDNSNWAWVRTLWVHSSYGITIIIMLLPCCWLVCQQYNAKSYWWIFMKFLKFLNLETRNNRLDYGGDLSMEPGIFFSICLTLQNRALEGACWLSPVFTRCHLYKVP